MMDILRFLIYMAISESDFMEARETNMGGINNTERRPLRGRLYNNHRHSHVPASGGAPTNVREGNWCTIMVACNCPRNSLLKIKKIGF